ncbi:hypothetical protein [Paraburkholderia sp. BL10I2N1]|uniref:hypothetical protein n=1 Tax=Paraburkholderia sp. BL10I2N1 TaxID=1938796 RepID=UPI001FB6D9A5|nr:hypothetical protein [Paraburkholderia sp. BL10I2N1]
MNTEPFGTPASFAMAAVAAPRPSRAISLIALSMMAWRLSSLFGLAMIKSLLTSFNNCLVSHFTRRWKLVKRFAFGGSIVDNPGEGLEWPKLTEYEWEGAAKDGARYLCR